MPFFLAALVYASIYVGTTILSAILNRNAGRSTPPGEPTFPTADPTKPIPVVFGTTRVGMNVIHKARVTTGENTVRNGALSFGWSSTKIGTYYYLDMAAVICHGPVGALKDVIVDGTRFLSRVAANSVFVGYDPSGIPVYTTYAGVPSLPFYTVDGGSRLATIYAGDILGGKFDRGGIGAGSADAASTGAMRFYPGNGWNESNTQLESLAGFDLPTYPNLCWVAFENNFYFGNQPSLPSVELVITRPCVAPFLGTGLLGNVTANTPYCDASAAGVIWEILTNPVWGLGLPESALNESSFNALDNACNAGLGEDGGLFLGLSFVVDTQVSAKSLLTDVLRTLDGVLYADPETGLINVRLLQHAGATTYGYGISNEYILDASVINSVEWTESAPDAQANEVKVEFVDRTRDYTKNTVTVRNVAAIQQLGRVESRAVSFIGVQNADVAARLGMRELRAMSTTLGHATIELDRTGYRLTPGQFFTLNWNVAGKSSRLMRCLTQKDAPNGKCVIEAVEDVYSTPSTTYAVETTPEPTPVGDVQYIAPYVEPQFAMTRDYAKETLVVYDPQGHVTAVEFGATSVDNWHVAYDSSFTNTPNTNPYVNYVQRTFVDTPSRWRVSYTAQDGSTAYLTGDFPIVSAAVVPETPILRWSVSGGMVTVTASWNDAGTWDPVQPDCYLSHSASAFPTYSPGSSTPVGTTSTQSITFPYPAAGTIEYVSAWRAFNVATTGRSEASEYAFLTIVGADAGTIGAISSGPGSLAVPVLTLDDVSLAAIATASTELDTRWRRKRYLLGAGLGRTLVNVTAVSGSGQTFCWGYSTDNFATAPNPFAPVSIAAVGQYDSGWVPLPSAMAADIQLTPLSAGGGGTASATFSATLEVLPALVTALRDFSDDFSDDFS